MADSRNRGPTFRTRLRVDVGVFEPMVSCQAIEVARHGLMLSGLSEVNTGQMVWLHIYVPGGQVAEATATVRKILEDGNVVVDFSMFLRGTHRLWDQALANLEQVRTLIPQDSERRKFPRKDDVRFIVRAGDQAWESLNYSVGGMQVRSPVVLELGTAVELELVHPESKATFTVRSEVCRADEGNGTMGLRFLDLGDTSRSLLRRFFETGEAPPDD